MKMITRSTNGTAMENSDLMNVSELKKGVDSQLNIDATCKLKYQFITLLVLFMSVFLSNSVQAQFQIGCPVTVEIDCIANALPYQASDLSELSNEICGLGTLDPTTFTQSAPVLFSGSADCNDAIYEVELRIFNTCGMDEECDAFIRIVNDGPTIACPSLPSVNVCDLGTYVLPQAILTTPCTGTSLITSTTDLNTVACAGGTVIVNYNFTDAVCGGGIVNANCTLTVAASTPLVPSCPASVTIPECSDQAAIQLAYTNWANGFSVIGGCNPVTTNIASRPILPAFQCGAGFNLSFQYEVSDACNTVPTICTSTITIASSDAPVITCPANGTVTCSADLATATPIVTTTCGLTPAVTNTGPILITGSPDCNGAAYNITYTVTDDCNRNASCTQTVTIVNADPIIVCPANVTVTCASDVVAGIPTTTVSCDVASSIAVVGPTLASGTDNCNGATYSIMYTVTDGCNRSANCTQTITLANAAPTITCPANTSVTCTANVVSGTPVITSVCNLGLNTTVSVPTLISGTANCNGAVYNLIYTVEDACNRTATCTQTVTLDNVAPTITCPANTIAVCAVNIAPGTPAFTTSCGVTSSMTTSGPTLTSGLADCDGSIYTIAYTVTDACNRIASCNQTVTIQNAAPTINCTANMTVACTADISSQTPTVTTSCGLNSNMTTVGPTLTSGIANCNGATYSIQYSVTDVCGRNATCNQTITLVNAAPTITCPANTTATCVADIVVGSPTITSSCDVSPNMTTTGPTLVNGVANCNGSTYNIVYSVSDACNRNASCTQVITLINNPPTISCPPDATVDCTANIIAGTPNISTSCSLTSSMTTSGPVLVSGLPNCNGSVYRFTYTATDGCSRTDQCFQNITIANATPTITCPADAVVSCFSDIVAGTPAVLTSCGLGSNMSTTGPTLMSGEANCNGSIYSIVYTGADACGRSGNCTQSFTIQNVGPQITACPPLSTATCHSDLGTIAAAGRTSLLAGGVTMSCGSSFSVLPEISAFSSNCTGTPYTITYTVTELGCTTARTTSCIQVVSLTNTGLSINVCPPATTASCHSELGSIGDSGRLALSSAGVTTACGNDYSVNSLVSPFLNNCNGTAYSITYTVTENGCPSARSSTCAQIVTLDNSISITCPTQIDVDACAINGYIPAVATVNTPCATDPLQVFGSVGAYTGGCAGGTVIVTYSFADPGCTPVSRECVVVVTASETTTITCAEATGEVSACDVLAYVPPLATVNLRCGGTTLISGIKQPYTGGCAGGTFNIVYTYSEVGCLPVTKVCPVIVTPEPAPTITCPTIQPVGICNMFTFTPPVALVNLGCEGITSTPGIVGDFDGDCSGGSVIVTYEFDNGCGSPPAECMVVVTGDTEGPSVTCPPNMVDLECGTRLPAPVRSFSDNRFWNAAGGMISDNCDSDVIVEFESDSADPDTFSFCIGSTLNVIRTYRSTDDCGKEGKCTQTFSYKPDTEAPAITNCDAITDITIECGAPNSNRLINNWVRRNTNLLRIGISDNCVRNQDIFFSNDYDMTIPSFSCNLGVNPVITFYAEDGCNRSVCTARINITDTQAPKATCPPAKTGILCDQDVPAAATTDGMFISMGGTPGVTITGSGAITLTGSGTGIGNGFDNCAPEVWVLSKDDLTKDDLMFCMNETERTIVRTYYLTDDCGNTTSCTQNLVYEQDLSAPTLVCPPLTLVADPHVCHIDIVLPDPTASDGCSGVKEFINSNTTNRYEVGIDTIIWTVKDNCHNENKCEQIITVLDQQSPNIACSADTICLPLDAAGNLVVLVDMLYSSIEDNCQELKPTLVQKLGSTTPPASQLNFDCSALGDTCMVQVIATDQYDNSNICMRTIVVKDVIPPFIECPDAITVNCEFPLNLSDLSNVGTVVISDVTDACGVQSLNELTAVDTGFKCQTGGGVVRTITRTFEAIDSSGNNSTCTQVVSVIDDDPFTEEDIMWLPNVEVSCMGATSVDSLGQPGIMSDACSQILFDHTDMTFDLQANACRRIMRIWKVIDWCQFDRSTTPITGQWIDTQFIDIVSDVPPVLNGTFPDREICATACNGGRFQMSFDGRSGCSDFGVFGYLYNIQLEDGRVIQSTGNNIDQELPLGTHNVILTIKDNCHQISRESFKVTMKDCKAPALVCINGLVVNLMDTSPPMVPIWASDFSVGTKDNCTADGDIIYSFSADTSDIQEIYTCSQADRNLGVTIFATDEHGNQASCETRLEVQSNGVNCAAFLEEGEAVAEEDTQEEESVEEETTETEDEVVGNTDEVAMVSGKISNFKGEGIMDTEVNIQSSAMDDYKMTSDQGGYAFESLDMYKDYMVKPSKTDNPLNGVSTLDIVLIQKHILGLSVISDPYLRIAADIDGSNSVSARDLVELRKLILGSIEDFSNNESWRFVDASYDFDQNDLWSFPEEIEYRDLENNEMSTDFVGIKIGDINGNATTNFEQRTPEVRSSEKMKLVVDNNSYVNGDNLIVGLTAKKDIGLNGMQLALRIDEDLELVDVISAKLKVRNDQYRIIRNELVISWSQEELENVVDGDKIFKLAFKAKGSGNVKEAIQLVGDRLSPEVYDEDMVIYDVVLDAESNNTVNFQLYQNRPNPFIAATEIEFNLPKAMEATIVAYDVKGQILLKKSAMYQSGLNRLMITKDELGVSSGVIYYRLEAGEFNGVKTMILIE